MSHIATSVRRKWEEIFMLWFYEKKLIDVYYFILLEWSEVFFDSSIFNHIIIILIYFLQKNFGQY